MRVAIIGAGAVGKWLAAVHLRAGHDVLLVCRNHTQAQALHRTALSVKGWEGEKEYKIRIKTWDMCRGADFSAIDVYLITVKAHHWPAFYNQWETIVGPRKPSPTLWIAVHNGYVDYSSAAPSIAAQICRSVLTYGLTATDQTSVEVRGTGDWSIEAPADTILSDRFNDWLASIRKFVNATDVNDIESLFWRKLLLNACLNPVTALTGLTNGKVWDSPFARTIVKELAREAQMVCEQALGIKMNDLLPYIEQVCAVTYDNRSSMLQDVLAGRETEIDALNGIIIQFAQRYGIEVKYHHSVFYLIKAGVRERNKDQT